MFIHYNERSAFTYFICLHYSVKPRRTRCFSFDKEKRNAWNIDWRMLNVVLVKLIEWPGKVEGNSKLLVSSRKTSLFPDYFLMTFGLAVFLIKKNQKITKLDSRNWDAKFPSEECFCSIFFFFSFSLGVRLIEIHSTILAISVFSECKRIKKTF